MLRFVGIDNEVRNVFEGDFFTGNGKGEAERFVFDKVEGFVDDEYGTLVEVLLSGNEDVVEISLVILLLTETFKVRFGVEFIMLDLSEKGASLEGIESLRLVDC